MMSVKSIRALKLMMPIVALVSFMTQFIAIITNDWLHTIESMPNPNYEKLGMPADMEFFRKYTTSGLWTLCYNDPPDLRMQCIKIDYFSQEEYIPDQNDSTMAIPYAVKKAAIYIMISTVLLVLGQTIYFMSQVCRSRRIYIFISGIPSILAGLLILTGIVVYISTFKNEVGYKLRPISQFQDALFDYRYGYSFLFLVASLLLCELSGTLSIFLYVSQKHFKIMIDIERDEVLKHNIINILRSQHKMADHRDDIKAIPPIIQPRMRITNEDYNEDIKNSGNNSPTNQNFLSPDIVVDSAYYQCGRHGSRGRRNSRSNESYLGSPRESTSDLKALRNITNIEKSCNQSVQIKNEELKIVVKNPSNETINSGAQLQELYVGGLLQISQKAHLPQMDLQMSRTDVDEKDQEKLFMSYPISFIFEKQSKSKTLPNTADHLNKNYESNKSTFV